MPGTTDIDHLAYKLGDRLRAMEASNVPPYEVEPFDLGTGDIRMLIKALNLLEAVRVANS